MKETKIKAVLDHLKTKGNISPLEAIHQYNATRLSSIIFDLKRKGYNIHTIIEDYKGSRYARYYLTKEL